MLRKYKTEIERTLLIKPWLELIEHDLYGIAERIREIEDGYFVAYNRRRKSYEVHSALNRGIDTYCFKVNYETLDDRTLQLCRETNIAQHGKKIYEKMEEERKQVEAANEKDFKNQIESISQDSSATIGNAVERDELGGCYNKFHVIGG